MSKPRYVPEDVSRMECLVLSEVLRRIKSTILEGTPSGQAIDQALKETLELATRPASAQAAEESEGPPTLEPDSPHTE